MQNLDQKKKESVEKKEEEEELGENEMKVDEKGQQIINEEQIPDHFYDSDLNSINEKDFLSDNQPPKDQIQQRKLLYKQKLLHVFKTIVRLGYNLDKPAPFDRIHLKYKQVPLQQVVPHPLKKNEQWEYPQYFSSFYLMNSEVAEYNVGKQYKQIERLVTSMKKGETAVFELEHLQTSKKSGIKIRKKVEVFVIGVEEWTTVIDMDCDGKYMKHVLRKGEGHSRIHKHDQVAFEFVLSQQNKETFRVRYDEPVKIEDKLLDELPNVTWKLLNSMKEKQQITLQLQDQVMVECEGDKYQRYALKQQNGNNESNKQNKWFVTLEVLFFHSIDDVFLDGRLLKKRLVRGVSTAKPESSSLIYYALKFLGPNKQILQEDKCFNSDWWQDFGKLNELGCRKNYLDDFSMSMMFKQAIKRMKPAEIAEIQCRDKTLFEYGLDYDHFKQLTGLEEIPERIWIIIRVYNFTEGKNCFNMELEEKVEESKRKKVIAVSQLKKGNIDTALKLFENIISFYGSGQINQQGYNEKVSALMNSILCYMKKQDYIKILQLCEKVLESPKHGYDIKNLQIKGPSNAKIEGKLGEGGSEERKEAGLNQNKAILDKCNYRKGLALVKIGEAHKAIECLNKIEEKAEEVVSLLAEAQKQKERYQKKSVKMYKNMFG